ncbi:TonB-dependent receptor [Roseococcus sp. YIM B11640]|uniref:TonB-dependent receptor n=1 Tax=Roseococcus sp. YIM B11640 TaxID=3133973 RepID=UPI003C7D7470
MARQVWVWAVALWPGMAWAQEIRLPEVPIVAPAMADPASASEVRVTGNELLSRPVTRPAEVLEAAPGLIVTQHSGEGKANQYFLRGFNLDHGTDLAITLDGMPLNMPTHGHGQGYTDLNFLIPELLGGMRVRKGPYFADVGDFGSAGALDLTLRDTLPRPVLQLTGGSFGYWRALAMGSFNLGAGRLLLAGEAAGYDGPWRRPDELRRINGIARYSQGGTAEGFTVTAMAYSGRWSATDQIPARAVSEGIISRYGTMDPTDGGETQRYSLSANWHRQMSSGTLRASAYVVRSTLSLFNNFTYFLDDPEHGDQFRQQDRRWVTGFDVSHTMPGQVWGRALETRIGVQGRYDDIALALRRTEARAPLSTVRTDAVRQGSIGLWSDATLRATEWLRATVGLRVDAAGGRVSSLLPENSGRASDALVSPKFGLVLGPWRSTELFLNAGTGYHSNDLRGATISVDPTDRLTTLSRVPLLVRSKGAEIGARTRWAEGFESSLAVFVLDLASEIVFVGDAGTTEASRPSRRIGVELTNRWQVTPWLSLDADIAATRARFTDDDPAGDRIPGAPEVIASAGASFGTGGPGWFGTARLRYFGARPLVEDNSVRAAASTLVNGRVGYRFENGMTAQLDLLNAFNARANQIEYFYTSRLRSEAVGVADRHIHPTEPTAFRFTLSIPL